MKALWARRGGGAVLAAVLAAAGAAPAAADEGCKLLQVGEFPLSFIGRRAVLDAAINGQPTTLLVDTGSDSTLLFHDRAEALGLALRPVPNLTFYGVGGGAEASTARIAVFKVGPLSARDMDVFVTGVSAGVVRPANTHGPAGLLGEAFLGQADVEFDFPEKKMRFFKPKNCAGDQVVYWRKAYSVAPMLPVNRGDKIDVMVALNGHPVRAELDTGASTTIVTNAAAEGAGVRSPDETAAGRSTGLGNQAVPTYAAVFQSFAFGDEVIRNAKLRVADLFAADTVTRVGSRLAVRAIDPPQMLLGADFFTAHRVYVARSQGKVYISYVGGPVFDFTAPPPKPPPSEGAAAPPGMGAPPAPGQGAASPPPSP